MLAVFDFVLLRPALLVFLTVGLGVYVTYIRTFGLTVSATVDGLAFPRLWHAIRVFHTVVLPQPAGPRTMTLGTTESTIVAREVCRRASS